MKTVARVLFAFVFVISLIGTTAQVGKGSPFSANNQQSVATIFSPPLGFRNGIHYSPRFTHDNSGNLIENTDYGIQNPDLNQFSACFGTAWNNLYHAGQDLYRSSGQSTSGDEVTAIADGIVTSVNTPPFVNYPGAAIIIRHPLPSGLYAFSVYVHLENVSSLLTQNASVIRGQRLGTVIYQPYDGNYPQYHPAPLNDDSHLHFEMRLFPSAANIYTDHPACNLGDAPGRGYTFPQLPDNFPTPQTGYRNPRAYVPERIFLPIIMNNFYSCSTGAELLANGGFESGHISWVESNYQIIFDTSNTTISPQTGSWISWLGGRNYANDTIYQQVPIAQSLSSANLSYYVWMGTDETSGTYDKFYVMLRNSSGGLIQQLDYLDNSYSNRGIWVQRSLSLPDLTPWRGQNIRISFEATTDGTYITNFFLDDVSLAMVCGGTYRMSSGVRETLPGNNALKIGVTGIQQTKPVSPTPTSLPYP
jgi:murein DD-endopeptidase MepM/ murein hydrolase activator NlpD